MTTRISIENRKIAVVDEGKSICTCLGQMDDESLRKDLVDLGIFSVEDINRTVNLTLIRDKIGEVFNAARIFALGDTLTCTIVKPSTLRYEVINKKELVMVQARKIVETELI
jgi:hypothetical protein